MKNKTLSPLLLRAFLPPADSSGAFPVGYSVSAPPLSIYNPNKTAMLIDQLRFRPLPLEPAEAAYAERDAVGIPLKVLAGLGVEVLLGSIPITNRTVTLGALCPRYNNFAVPATNIIDAGPSVDPVAVWHLPRPLYVPPLVQLTIRIVRQPVNGFTLVDFSLHGVDVVVAGRSLPSDFPVPSEIDVPWVAETQCNTDAVRFVSADSDLVNKNLVPLDIHQLVGFNYWSNEAFNSSEVSPNPTFGVQMSSSNGTLIIRDSTPFFACFPAAHNVLPMSARLQPGEFFRAQLEVGRPDNNNCSFTAVAMHGCRKIQTPGTLG